MQKFLMIPFFFLLSCSAIADETQMILSHFERGTLQEEDFDEALTSTDDLESCQALTLLKEAYQIDPLLENAKGLLDLLDRGEKNYPEFDGNPLFTSSMKAEIRPYLIPLNHPLKPSLDALFYAARVLESRVSLKDAGFIILHDQPSSFVIVARHPAFPGWIFKLYLDTEMRLKENTPGWKWLVNRCDGATRIRNLIRKKKIKSFAVPDKWLYPLPYTPGTNGAIQQPLLVIETDMELVSSLENKQAWKTLPTKALLKELYVILSEGYGSWFLTGNIPYSKRGQFVFIDTEYPKRTIKLHKVKEFLSPEMGAYWDKLIDK